MKNHYFLKMFLLLSFFILSEMQSVMAQFTNGNLVVLRVGNGVDTLINLGNQCYFHEYTSNGTLVNTIPIPVNGPDKFCLSGSASSEGQISRSPDGSLLCLAGYKISPPYSSSLANSTAADVNRIVVKVNHAGMISIAATTSTAFSANNIRSAVSDGNNNYWAAGGNTGVYHFGINSSDTAVVSNTSTNIRYIAIFNSQLYYITNKGNFGLYKVGTATPSSPGQISTNVISTGATSSPFAFSINATSDTCYIADDRAVTSGGGIQKWINNAGSWTLAYTLGSGSSSSVGCRSLTVNWNSAYPVIYATTAEASNNRLIKIVDSSALATTTIIATSAANTIFRGLAFTPENNTIQDNIPNYTIHQVKSVNPSGVADSVNVYCRLTAVVHGINYANFGLSFYIMDTNAGIHVVNTTTNLGYTVTEGDRIRVIGRIQQNRGLIEIIADSIVKLSVGNILNTPVNVNTLNEANESLLIKMDGLVYLSGWPVIAGPTATVIALKGSDTITLKIFSQCSLQGSPAPMIPFSITGIESQFTSTVSPPFLSAYLIFPRYISDLNTTSIHDLTSENPDIRIYPNPSNGKFQVVTKNALKISIYTIDARLIYNNENSAYLSVIDISRYGKGLYLLKIEDIQSNSCHVSKLIVR